LGNYLNLNNLDMKDINGDGFPDIVSRFSTEPILLNDGTGTEIFGHYLAANPGALGLVRFEHGLVQADVNGDGVPDFEVALTHVTQMTGKDFVL
jgi:hypothetical protein